MFVGLITRRSQVQILPPPLSDKPVLTGRLCSFSAYVKRLSNAVTRKYACGAGLPMALIDNAKPVSLGIRQDHKVWIFGVQVPVNTDCAQIHEPRHLACLLLCVVYDEVEVHSRCFARRRIRLCRAIRVPSLFGGVRSVKPLVDPGNVRGE